MDKFYIGLHQPSDAKHFERCCISIRRLLTRQKPLGCPDVLVDSAAFTELALHGRYTFSTAEYAAHLRRLYCDGVVAITGATAQDYMCEAFMIKKTGLNVYEHQKRTIQRYDRLLRELDRMFDGNCPFHVLPVLQGYRPHEYSKHIEMYGDRLKEGMWVGVGSICKRNSKPLQIVAVLSEIKKRRPDLLLHGFGVKQTALDSPQIRSYLHTTDSLAWSFAAKQRSHLGSANDWRVAKRYADQIEQLSKKKSKKYFWR